MAGCGNPSPQENVSQACAGSEAFGAALKTFQDTLTTDVVNARNDVDSALNC